MIRPALVLALLTIIAAAAPARAEELVTLQTRPGVTQSFHYMSPAGKPAAALVLFVGGDGKLRSWGPPNPERGNFLARVRGQFAERGFAVAVPDAPSDQPNGMGAFRGSPEHAADIAAIVAWLAKATGAPVWLVGTSRGTISAANAAAALPGIAGLVLTSSILREPRGMSGKVFDVALDRIRMPVLVVHHRNDGCPVCPFPDTASLMQALRQATRKELVATEGGLPPRSEPCEALAAHGYFGIESQVVEVIAAFVKRG